VLDPAFVFAGSSRLSAGALLASYSLSAMSGWCRSKAGLSDRIRASRSKTVATRLDEADLSAREIADHLGHARLAMTQDVYMGRGVASAAAAQVLLRDAA
jgi:integrase